MTTLTVRLSDEATKLIEHRGGELSDMSINMLVNLAVRQRLAPDQNRAFEADDNAVATALNARRRSEKALVGLRKILEIRARL